MTLDASFIPLSLVQMGIETPPGDITGISTGLLALARMGAGLLIGMLAAFLVLQGYLYMTTDETTRGVHLKRGLGALLGGAIIVLVAVTIAPQIVSTIINGVVPGTTPTPSPTMKSVYLRKTNPALMDDSKAATFYAFKQQKGASKVQKRKETHPSTHQYRGSHSLSPQEHSLLSHSASREKQEGSHE